MTSEELRAEADRQGYYLVSRLSSKMLVCPCGCRRRHWFSYHTDKRDPQRMFVECDCGRRVYGRTTSDTIRSWNKEIIKLHGDFNTEINSEIAATSRST